MPAADFIFDGENKLIKLASGVTVVDMQDLYSRWKDWVRSSDNAKWAAAFRVVGGDPLVSPAIAPVYYFLINGWKLQPYNADHSLTISINLYVDGGGDPFVGTVDTHQVSINNVTSDAPGVANIAAAVWDAKLEDHVIQGSFGRHVGKKLLTLAKWIALR